MIEKCKYFNDSVSACSLMIDDLVPAYVKKESVFSPDGDWGYLAYSEKSLYKYFERFVIEKFPEIKGTIFLPLSSENYITENSGYEILKSEVTSNYFLSFLNNINCRFELAFHGDKHEYWDEGELIHEFKDISETQVEVVKERVNEFVKHSGYSFKGGKFPGYSYNNTAKLIIKKIKAYWWALDSKMMNVKSKYSDINFDKDLKIVLIPTTVSGDIFSSHYEILPFFKIKKFIKWFLPKYIYNPKKYLAFLYRKGYPIIIQEHFQNFKPTGERQRPNVFDDIDSINQILSFTRGKDIWFANCSDIAKHYDVYVNSEIIKRDLSYNIEYKGALPNPLLTLKSDKSCILDIDKDIVIHGRAKNGFWIFNDITPGTYKEIENGDRSNYK